MRLIQRSRLVVLALFVAAPLTLGMHGCSKDEEAATEAEEKVDDESEEASSSDDPSDEEEESAATSEEEAEEESSTLTSKEGADAVDEEAAAREPRPRGDKARDRIRDAKADEGSDDPKAEVAEAKPSVKEGDGEAADTAQLQSPAERRKVERERRIAELKRRNEERRKDRMAKVDEKRREAEAVAELAQPVAHASVTSRPVGLDIKKYVTQTEVRKLVGNDTLVAEGRLSGGQPSKGYNSAYFAMPVRSSFGVSVQVWQDKTRRDANVRFRRMRAQYTNAEDTTAPTSKSFVSSWEEILTLSFANLTKRVVVSVSCSTKLCKPKQLLALAESISGKI